MNISFRQALVGFGMVALLGVGGAVAQGKQHGHIEGLTDYSWKQKGGAVEIEVYDLTDDPLWPPLVEEAVKLWNRPPFALTYIRGVTPTNYSGKIVVSDDDVVAYCGITYIFRTQQGDMDYAAPLVCNAASYADSSGKTQQWWMQRAIRHEIGNALTVGEVGVHNFVNDFECVMGNQLGNTVTDFDFNLLCQKYRCR